MHFLKRVALLAIAITFSFSTGTKEGSAYELATDIADHYIKSFPSEGIQNSEPAKVKKAHEAQSVHLDEKKKREVLLNAIFTKSKDYTLVQNQAMPVLNKHAWKDLHLFYGTTTTPAYHLMSRINKTDTLLGEGALATMLVTPLKDIQALKKRQAIIQAFLDHEETVAELKNSLQYYQEGEERVFSLWTPGDPLYTKEYQKYMNSYFYSKNSPQSNKSATWLELKKRYYRDFWGVQARFFFRDSIPPISMEIAKIKWPDLKEVQTEIRDMQFKFVPYYGTYLVGKDASMAIDERQKEIDQLRKESQNQNTTNSHNLQVQKISNAVEFGKVGAAGLRDLLYTGNVYSGFSNYLEYAAVLRNLALRMADVQAFVVAATEVSECIAEVPELEELYGDKLVSIRKLLSQSKKNTELGRLVYYLQKLPYNSWSYFFNNAGRLLASHKLFTEHKDEFADAMYALGELDAFLSVTSLMQESQNNGTKHAYHFTKFLGRSQKQKPYVKLESMWNPFLEAKQAVGNSVEMDAEKGIRNIILTGPNAGGKSTFLTGITTSLLLSQTFGIAPAKEAVITPFDKINTYIDIADDIAAGKSLFMAEVSRAQEHLNMLDKLKANEFSFSIFDEPFSGTNPTEGAAAEYSILEAMGEYANTMNIVATHYPTVMLLEKNASEKGFRNYKVYIKSKKGEKINYTYKVIPGKSNQAIAIDILEEQGYDIRLLRRAREIIEHPERYNAKF